MTDEQIAWLRGHIARLEALCAEGERESRSYRNPAATIDIARATMLAETRINNRKALRLAKLHLATVEVDGPLTLS